MSVGPESERDLKADLAQAFAIAWFCTRNEQLPIARWFFPQIGRPVRGKYGTVPDGPTLASHHLKHTTKGLSDDVEWVVAVAAAECFDGFQSDGTQFRAE